MASLTETAFYTRRAVNWGIVAVIGYIVLRIFWGMFIVLWLTIFPPKPPPPNYAFGKLPALVFPVQTASPSSPLIYHLETIQGSIPSASDTANIYFMPKEASNLLAVTDAQTFAKKLNFDTKPIQETGSKTVYRFDDPTLPLRHLWYDIISKNFIIKYNYAQDAGIFLEKNIPNPQTAIKEASNFMKTHSLLKDDFVDGSQEVIYLKFSGNTLVETTSQSQADAVRVNFYRHNVANTKVVTATPGKALISFVISGAKDTRKRIVEITYTYWPLENETYATYGLISGTQAFEALQSGYGYIVSYPLGSTVATIRNVTLAYYDAVEPQTYMQPIFVFTGDNGFMAYVPAVNPDWIEIK